MTKYPIVPSIDVGPVTFGISPEEVLQAMSGLPVELINSLSDETDSDQYHQGGF